MKSMPNIDATKLARDIRVSSLKMVNKSGTSHIGSVLGICDILAVLYANFLQVDDTNPFFEDRDRFILSKGHAGAGLYATLAELGFFSKELLMTHGLDGSILSGHVSSKKVPGVEFSTGSLGHGLGVAAGIALSAQLDKKSFKTVCLMSDGECDEGSVWEAALFAAHHKLSGLIAVIDYNKLQSLGKVADTLGLEPLAEKWRNFGWEVAEVDGNDINQLRTVFEKAFEGSSLPFLVVAHTVKGKGVSFMEDSVLWHYRSPNSDELEAAIEELCQI